MNKKVQIQNFDQVVGFLMERLKYSIESDTRTCKVSLSWNLNAPGLPSKGLNETLPPDNGDISLYLSVHKAVSSFADVIVSLVFLLYVLSQEAL